MHFCFTLSKKQSDETVQCYADKARRFANLLFTLKLDGDNCRFHRHCSDASSNLNSQSQALTQDLDDDEPSITDNYGDPDSPESEEEEKQEGFD